MSLFPDSLVLLWPQLLWLLPLPLLVYFVLPPAAQNEAALRLPTYAVLAGIAQDHRHFPAWSRLLLLCLIWLLTVMAAARPQWIGEAVQLPATGRDLLLAVDISGSMNTPDMVMNGEQIPRIVAVKNVVSEFVKRRTGDRLGLILFGTQAYLHVPLTFDRQVVEQQLKEAQIGFAGENTAIGDGIAIAVKKLRERPAQGRVLILLTDGANNSGEIDPRQAADLARLAGVKIHTIGIGADSMVVRNFFFSQKINPSADLDEKALTYIAESTGGKYFRARDPKQLEAIYQEIDQLDPVEQEKETFRPVRELFFYPLAVAAILSFVLALVFVVPVRYRMRKTPEITA
jgi:Ca-activated chloride channel family protein